MAKQREIIRINEEKLKELMAGTSPSTATDDSGQSTGEEGEKQPIQVQTFKAYIARFLSPFTIRRRRSCTFYLDTDSFEILNKNLTATGRQITFSSYLNRIVSEHIQTHHEVFDDLYRGFKKDF